MMRCRGMLFRKKMMNVQNVVAMEKFDILGGAGAIALNQPFHVPRVEASNDRNHTFYDMDLNLYKEKERWREAYYGRARILYQIRSMQDWSHGIGWEGYGTRCGLSPGPRIALGNQEPTCPVCLAWWAMTDEATLSMGPDPMDGIYGWQVSRPTISPVSGPLWQRKLWWILEFISTAGTCRVRSDFPRWRDV